MADYDEYMKRFRRSTRSMARNDVHRGEIEQKPCSICCSYGSEMHHPDYTRFRLVIWLCRSHHNELHRYERDGRVPPLRYWDELPQPPIYDAPENLP